jgi:ribosomal protein L12E/L44/L45/RPP1/RPP2
LPAPARTRYILRRSKTGFRSHAGEADPARLAALVAEARSELEVVRRQALVHGLYARRGKSVLARARPPPAAPAAAPAAAAWSHSRRIPAPSGPPACAL